MRTLGEEIRHACERKGLTPELLAALTGKDAPYIDAILHDEQNPTPEALQQIADALGEDVTDWQPLLRARPSGGRPPVPATASSSPTRRDLWDTEAHGL